jgi:hypothetical protein
MNKLVILSLILITACSKTDPQGNDHSVDSTYEWLIPIGSVRDGGPGKDGIPSIDKPLFASIGASTYLNDSELVLVSNTDGEVKIYPHQILDWHEIVNDRVGNKVLAIIYCPLTGSGLAWNRVLNEGTTTFGVSGLLYNNNVIPYDRASGSNWSQIRRDCVNGNLIGTTADVLPLLETSYKTAKEMYPSALVLTRETGYSRSYGNYPYNDYRESGKLIFQIDNLDHRLHEKERILAIMDGTNPHVYRFSSFEAGTSVIENSFMGKDYIIVGDKDRNFMVAFTKPAGSETYTPIQDSSTAIMMDSSGNKYDIFGTVVEGPNTGLKLRSPENYIAYWFSIAAIYPDVEIYE